VKKIILTAIAALALSATQASAQSAYYGGLGYYGGTGYYGSSYAASGPYVHIGTLDLQPNYYSSSYVQPASYRSSLSYPSYSYGSSYSVPYSTYSYGSSYSYPSSRYSYVSQPYTLGSTITPASYRSSYVAPTYSSSYVAPLSTSYIAPATYRSGVVSTVPYTNYSSSYGCRC